MNGLDFCEQNTSEVAKYNKDVCLSSGKRLIANVMFSSGYTVSPYWTQGLNLNSLLVTRQMTLFHQGVRMGEKLVP